MITLERKSEYTMCEKIKELNGLTADTILNKYWQRDVLPINIAKILYDMEIKVSAFDFSNTEKKVNAPNGLILGAVITQGNDLAIIYKKDDFSLNRVRFTLAHELAHCCLSHIKPNSKGYVELQLNCNDPHEKEANVFAGELLIPKRELQLVLMEYFPNSFPVSKVLAQIFSVSVKVMETRLKYLRIPFIDINGIKIWG